MNTHRAVAESSAAGRWRFQQPPGVDRFSNLPDPIIYLIFSCLYTFDLFKISIVCKKWRDMMKSLPHMIFDIDNFTHRQQGQAVVPTSIAHEKFKHFISWVFAYQEGIHELHKLTINALNFMGENHVQKWIALSMKRKLKELNLTLNSQVFFELPISLLKSETLEVLKLVFKRDCFVRIPQINLDGIFRKLKFLELVNVMLPDEFHCRRFISSCMWLEDLIIVGCKFIGMEQFVISLMNLKNLIIVSNGLIYTRLIIRCPRLESFVYRGFSPKDVDFTTSPLLKNAAINTMIEDGDLLVIDDVAKIINGFFTGVQVTKSLMLGSMFAEFFVRPVNARLFHNPFKNLTELQWTINMADITSLTTMLRACPKLEHLSIRFETKRCDETNCDRTLYNEPVECLVNHLVWVEIYNMGGHYNQFEVIEFLLLNSSIMQRMHIMWLNGTCDFSKREMIRNLIQIPFLSQDVFINVYDA